MKYTLNINDHRHLNLILKIPIQDILIQTVDFSLFGRIDTDKIAALIKQLKQNQKRVILSWDVLCTDEDLRRLMDIYKHIHLLFDAVRFVDPGVGACLIERYPRINLQFSLDHGQVNLPAIRSWQDLFTPNINRLIVSNQIPLKHISALKTLNVPLEIKGLGPVLLFYSRRHLIRPYLPDQTDYPLKTRVASQDRPDQVSAVVENALGTFMFNDRDLYLLDEYDRIEKSGVSYMGIELYDLADINSLHEQFLSEGWEKRLKSQFNGTFIQGFIDDNETQSSLSVLSNQFLKAQRENKVGVVLEAVKNSHCIVSITQPLKLPFSAQFNSPEGKQITTKIDQLSDLSKQIFTSEINVGEYILPWIKHVVSGTVMIPGEVS